MKKAQTYNSDLIDDLLNEITPREQKRTENRMLLAAKIADGLKAKGWSKQKLAEELGYKSSSIVTKWLSGTNNFTADLLSDIQDALDIVLLNTGSEKSSSVLVLNVSGVVTSTVDAPSSIDNEGHEHKPDSTWVFTNGFSGKKQQYQA